MLLSSALSQLHFLFPLQSLFSFEWDSFSLSSAADIFHYLTYSCTSLVPKVKVKYLRGAFGGAGHLREQIFHAPGAKLWHYAAELLTLSVTYPLCGLDLTNTTDNPSEMCPLKLTDFCLFLYH